MCYILPLNTLVIVFNHSPSLYFLVSEIYTNFNLIKVKFYLTILKFSTIPYVTLMVITYVFPFNLLLILYSVCWCFIGYMVFSFDSPFFPPFFRMFWMFFVTSVTVIIEGGIVVNEICICPVYMVNFLFLTDLTKFIIVDCPTGVLWVKSRFRRVSDYHCITFCYSIRFPSDCYRLYQCEYSLLSERILTIL